jgi:hypothetical protein
MFYSKQAYVEEDIAFSEKAEYLNRCAFTDLCSYSSKPVSNEVLMSTLHCIASKMTVPTV